MKKTNLLLILLLLGISCFAQSSRQAAYEKMQDADLEAESGELTLHFFNALTGAPVIGATIKIPFTDELTTDSEGKVYFSPQEDEGDYQVIFEKEGYITSQFTIHLMVGSIFFNRFSVSPVMDISDFRVVLDWDKHPSDLDAHFVKDGSYHISYRKTTALADGKAKLDRDDTNGYGPETITVKEISKDASYEYYIHDYSNRKKDNSSALSKSKATVKVYGFGKLLQIFEVPQNVPGNIWRVFSIESGQITPLNSVQ